MEIQMQKANGKCKHQNQCSCDVLYIFIEDCKTTMQKLQVGVEILALRIMLICTEQI